MIWYRLCLPNPFDLVRVILMYRIIPPLLVRKLDLLLLRRANDEKFIFGIQFLANIENPGSYDSRFWCL